jgi:hypothetical protein
MIKYTITSCIIVGLHLCRLDAFSRDPTASLCFMLEPGIVGWLLVAGKLIPKSISALYLPIPGSTSLLSFQLQLEISFSPQSVK